MNSRFPEIPDALRALMAELGPHWGTNPAAHVKLMVDQFSQILKQAPKEGVSVRRGIPYGSHSRQVFDLFTPDDRETTRAASSPTKFNGNAIIAQRGRPTLLD